MERVQVGYGKAHFSALLGRVEHGEELAIARCGKVIARLVPEKVIHKQPPKPWSGYGRWADWICQIH